MLSVLNRKNLVAGNSFHLNEKREPFFPFRVDPEDAGVKIISNIFYSSATVSIPMDRNCCATKPGMTPQVTTGSS